jgi:hypothetical protein
MSPPTLIALSVIVAVAILVSLIAAYRLDESLVERWARDRGVELTAENRPIVRRYLRNARVLRTWGGAAGAVLPSLIEFAWNGRVQVLGFGSDGTSAPLAFGAIFVGYLVGALWAEVSLARPVTGARRTASLVRRELEGYLPRRVIVAQRAVAAAGALGALAVTVVPYAASVPKPDRLSLLLAAAVVVVFGAGLEAIERWLVRRPQPFTSPAMVAADDAIRSHSVHTLAGAGLALLLLFGCGVAIMLQASDVALLDSTMVVAAVLCLLLSLASCQGIGERPWRVRRRVRVTGPASA